MNTAPGAQGDEAGETESQHDRAKLGGPSASSEECFPVVSAISHPPISSLPSGGNAGRVWESKAGRKQGGQCGHVFGWRLSVVTGFLGHLSPQGPDSRRTLLLTAATVA